MPGNRYLSAPYLPTFEIPQNAQVRLQPLQTTQYQQHDKLYLAWNSSLLAITSLCLWHGSEWVMSLRVVIKVRLLTDLAIRA